MPWMWHHVFGPDGSWLRQWQMKATILLPIMSTAHFTRLIGYPAEWRWKFYDSMEDEIREHWGVAMFLYVFVKLHDKSFLHIMKAFFVSLLMHLPLVDVMD